MTILTHLLHDPSAPVLVPFFGAILYGYLLGKIV